MTADDPFDLFDADDGISVEIYPDIRKAVLFLRGLVGHPGPWALDIETYDGAEFPSRKEVSTNPFHPDFRVRGVAIATSAVAGAWIDFAGETPSRTDAYRDEGWLLLADAFGTDAPKDAFSGGFDENGLIRGGFVPCVRNRARDGMLAMVALGDGSQRKEQHVFRLESAVARILGRPKYWEADKSMMRDLPIETVAAGAVRDACCTLQLCDVLEAMAAEGRYLAW